MEREITFPARAGRVALSVATLLRRQSGLFTSNSNRHSRVCGTVIVDKTKNKGQEKRRKINATPKTYKHCCASSFRPSLHVMAFSPIQKEKKKKAGLGTTGYTSIPSNPVMNCLSIHSFRGLNHFNDQRDAGASQARSRGPSLSNQRPKAPIMGNASDGCRRGLAPTRQSHMITPWYPSCFSYPQLVRGWGTQLVQQYLAIRRGGREAW